MIYIVYIYIYKCSVHSKNFSYLYMFFICTFSKNTKQCNNSQQKNTSMGSDNHQLWYKFMDNY